jgi:Rps23 Pro-64 3,4-dihydroxylase Tpa1-like proline 4-hydroxylase
MGEQRSVARVYRLDGFLPRAELAAVTRCALVNREAFRPSGVEPGPPGSEPAKEYRRSLLLSPVPDVGPMFAARLREVLPDVFRELDIEPPERRTVDMQMVATNDGGFFLPHRDDGAPRARSRKLTYVYFFNRQPRRFRGGELRIELPGTGRTLRITPRRNTIVFFAPGLRHEITPVRCESGAFEDSRFTLNGWVNWED